MRKRGGGKTGKERIKVAALKEILVNKGDRRSRSGRCAYKKKGKWVQVREKSGGSGSAALKARGTK